MTTSWQQITDEIREKNDPRAIDIVRREKLRAISKITDRPLVVYATDFTTKHPIKLQVASPETVIDLTDKDGFDEITRNLEGRNLDIILHSPGGSAEAAESIVALLRSRFDFIRFIIPSTAKSAATMLALSGNLLLMDEVSELGPTDPQMFITRDNQQIVAPAQAILDQFQKAQKEIADDKSKLPAWLPILREYGPALLEVCENQLALSHELVSSWLVDYMFSGDVDAVEKADRIAKYLSDHRQFRAHGRRVGITQLKELGAKVLDLRSDRVLHAAVRDWYTTMRITFHDTGAYKLFENSNDEAYIRLVEVHQENPPQATEQRRVPNKPRKKKR